MYIIQYKWYIWYIYTKYNWSNITTDTYQYNIQFYIFDLYISPHGSPRQCSSCSPPPYWWILPTNLTNPTQTNEEPTKQIYSNLFKSPMIRWYLSNSTRKSYQVTLRCPSAFDRHLAMRTIWVTWDDSKREQILWWFSRSRATPKSKAFPPSNMTHVTIC